MKTLLLAATAALAFVAALPANAAPPPGFDARVEALRKQFGVPGASIAIVENGKTTLAKGYGVRRLGSPEPVGADTIMTIGSTTKAFTAADLALLVDQGKIRWDDKVVDHMPWFQMYDPWVTREMTIRDLLVHRSGLGTGQGDLLFVPRSNRTRKEVVTALRNMKPKNSFRGGYAYDNILYMVAGQLIEEVTGETWEKFTRDHLLRPAGMAKSTSDDDGFVASPDHAQPHARINGAIRGVGDQQVLDERSTLAPVAFPAGGLSVSANDFARWLTIQLGQGALPEGGRLYSEAVANDMWRPVVLTGGGGRRPTGPLGVLQPMFSGYALGWNVQDFRGVKMISHSGAVFGFLTMVVLVPEKNIGFSIVINSEDGVFVRGLMYELLDHYLGFPKTDWAAIYAKNSQDQRTRAIAALQTTQATPAKVGPSLPLQSYAGDYVDPWYGPMTIRYADGKLRVDFTRTPGMTGTLDHYQYDSFRAVLDDKSIEAPYLNFGIGPDGKVERITLKAISPLADFSYDYQDLLFTPVAAKRP
ncbi:serine hydrolase [Sphingomonas quercus]|uniref:Serine hydrolase n=1 Tax=Sphingomonas quercus TaxID=2842451 RepID=A0ABS6BMU6_9SPHN|nr:serine hydrolase [Sphingomonas quercus]MBU3079504.1 serine hydrolase [Sphingomonas quercus]